MKYIKKYENINNIKIGNIYKTNLKYASFPYAENEKIISLVKILDINGNILYVKTFLKKNKEEYIFNCLKNQLTRIANKEEKEFFNSIENMKKYNL